MNPLEGRRALDLMERQVGEFGAKAFKFYNVRYDYGSPFPWRMDDPQIAFPIFEKAQELGVNLIGVHKGRAAGPAAGRGHPDLGHGRRRRQLPRHQLRDLPRRAAVPRRDLLAAHPLPQPLRLARRDDQLRRPGAARCSPRSSASCCSGAGEDKIVYGSEAPIFHPQWALQAFKDFSIPQDLCEGYGYPQLTDEAKRKILGENLLRLHGMDVEATKARLGRPQSH